MVSRFEFRQSDRQIKRMLVVLLLLVWDIHTAIGKHRSVHLHAVSMFWRALQYRSNSSVEAVAKPPMPGRRWWHDVTKHRKCGLSQKRRGNSNFRFRLRLTRPYVSSFPSVVRATVSATATSCLPGYYRPRCVAVAREKIVARHINAFSTMFGCS